MENKREFEAKELHLGNVEIGDVIESKLPEQPVVALEKRFSLTSAIAAGILTGNTWTALGGAIVASLYNGGPPGIIYEFVAVSVFYWLIAASIAELASAIPAAGGVYHWASITPGRKWGPVCGWYAGWFDFLAWNFGVAANCEIVSSMILYSYKLYHPHTDLERWQIYVCFLILCWMTCFVVMFANGALPLINQVGSFLILAGWFITIVVCAAMPTSDGMGHASNKFVWSKWQNNTGYSSQGFVFLAGMLNGAFAVGTPDCVTHLAEEIPEAGKNLPKVLLCQIVVGFVTAFTYMIALFYAIDDLSVIFKADSICPLGDIYLQATGSRSGAVGLLVVILLPVIAATVGCYITAGRTLYALARDDATPFSKHIGSISPRFKSPLWATFVCGLISTCLGAIYVGSTTAFNAFVGSFVLLTTSAFFLSIVPNLITRKRNIPRGSFWMGKWGYAINIISCMYIVVFFVIYCFPYALPVAADDMNYTSVMTCGLGVLVSIWWFIHGRGQYKGPVIAEIEPQSNISVESDGEEAAALC
ncbi:related to choline transport protein [Zygosaccharomyces bailii]|nr:related to choline transport protein [Zygosaccharomyces bailii]